jgi:hypothetical protein
MSSQLLVENFFIDLSFTDPSPVPVEAMAPVATINDILWRLPEGDEDTEISSGTDGEPPKKRARFDDHPDAILVDSYGPVLLSKKAPPSLQLMPAPACTRHDIGRFLRLKDSTRADENATAPHVTVSSVAGAPYGPYSLEMDTVQADCLEKLAPILNVMNGSRNSRNSEGSFWVTVDAHFVRTLQFHRIELEFKLLLNPVTSVPQGLPRGSSRKLHDQIQKAFNPFSQNPYKRLGAKNDGPGRSSYEYGLGVDDTETDSLSPQAFYKAAFLPDGEDTEPSSLSVPHLTSKLYPYQVSNYSRFFQSTIRQV